MMKSRVPLVLLTITIVILSSFSAVFAVTTYDDTPSHRDIEITVKELDNFNNCLFSEPDSFFTDAGYGPGDFVKVTLPNGNRINAMFNDSYRCYMPMEFFFAMEPGTPITFGLFDYDSTAATGLKVGDTMLISFNYHINVEDTFKHLSPPIKNNASDYNCYENFCNFRAVNIGNILPDTIYRSCGYVNPTTNSRAEALNELYERYGIEYEISLSASDLSYSRYYWDHPTDTYLHDIYANERTAIIEMNTDLFLHHEQNRETFLALINSPGKVCLHCDWGKDRTGFLFMMLEAVAGASNREIADDYLQSFISLYDVEEWTTEYAIILETNVKRSMYLFQDLSVLEHYSSIDWSTIDLEHLDYGKILRNYIRQYVLNDSEYAALYERLTGTPYSE